MPTPAELAMYQQYAGNDFQNQDWGNILKTLQSFPDTGDLDWGDQARRANAMSSNGGWGMDSYQPGGGLMQLTKMATNQTGQLPGGFARFDTALIDPKTGQPTQQWQQYTPQSNPNSLGSWLGDNGWMIPLALTGAAGMGWLGGGEAAGGGAGLGGAGGAMGQAGDYGMAAAGSSGAGTGMTGAGGIGSASSVAGSGAGAAGYGAAETGATGAATAGGGLSNFGTQALSTLGNKGMSSLVGAGLSAVLGGGGGQGSNTYQPGNQAGMDQNFQNNYQNYQNTLGNYFNTTNPLAQQTLQGQFNNPQTAAMLAAAQKAGGTYGAVGQNALNGSNQMFANAGQLSALQGNIQGAYGQNMGQVQNATNTAFGMANESNRNFQDLLNYQRGQQGQVSGTANQLYGMANRYGQNTDNLINYEQGQRGNVSNAANQLYGAASAIGNTGFDPMKNVYNQNVQDLTENIRAGEAARGIAMSPYGASVEADALGRFQNDWQTQQLGRQTQAAGAMSNASQSAQGLNQNYANNIAGLQGQGVNTTAGAGQGAQGMNNSYTSNVGNLNSQMGGNFLGLSQGGANMMEGFLTSQANNANTLSNAIGREYQGAAGLGNTAAQMQTASGEVPYQAQNNVYNNQNQALQNYYNNYAPYLSGLNQLQSNSLGYMNFGQGAQNQAWNQNFANNQQNQRNISSLSGPISQAIQSMFGGGGNYGDFLSNNAGMLNQGFSADDLLSAFG